jgi:hypothetical protein
MPTGQNDPRYSHLHDATLLSLAFDWKKSECTVSIKLHARLATLTWRAVTRVSITKEQPWGPSVSVNSLEQVAEHSWVMEIQSGDHLRIDALTLEPHG